jgi:hypothetical protein
MDRRGRVGDFQCRFRRGRISERRELTELNRPKGSVYSTMWEDSILVSFNCSGRALWASYVPVTLLEVGRRAVSITVQNFGYRARS